MANNSTAPVLRDKDEKNQQKKIADINLKFKERDLKDQAKKSGQKYIDLRSYPLNQDALQLTNWQQVQKFQAMPFELKGNILHLACVNPRDKNCEGISDYFQNKGYEVEKYICTRDSLEAAKNYFRSFASKEEFKPLTKIEEKGQEENWQKMFKEHQKTFEKSTGPEMLNKINLLATSFSASDVHFQPEEEIVKIRFRRDGELYEVYQISHKQYLLLSGEIKRFSGLKINIKNLPQDGEYEFEVNERKSSVRVSTLPSKYGESIVLRILDPGKALIKLEELGFSEYNMKLISEMLKKSKGLILVAGPTGSGKTSTLYSCLNILNQPDKKIITLEDPIEYRLKNIIQSEIKEQENYTFETGLRSVLRQDPDVIMVGEIRDKEAAEIALQASLTGHLVLSTVHANDAISTIPRLINMGVKPFILAAGLELIISQRLLRRICENCKYPVVIEATVREELDQVVNSLNQKGIQVTADQIYGAKGCEKCANTKFQGRVAVAEVLVVNDRIRSLILAGKSAQEIFNFASQEGFINIKEDGILKVLQGQTTLEEVWKTLI